MKRKRYTSNQKSNKNNIKRPPAVWFIVFGVLILLFAAFIITGIKAGEYAEKAKADDEKTVCCQIYTEETV